MIVYCYRCLQSTLNKCRIEFALLLGSSYGSSREAIRTDTDDSVAYSEISDEEDEDEDEELPDLVPDDEDL